MTSSSEVREAFLSYFEDRKHKRIRSGPLVPENDPTLLFVNAGMNQFKDVFLGLEKRNWKRAVTSQKCMRVSGKHNDLETVGRTARHHTFFEMLGNFSFGDYFKKKAIEYAWELCTDIYQIAPDRLSITVFQEDEDALTIWRDYIGIPEARIWKMGKKDNFWSMGDTGPCGPCSELHYDTGTSPAGHTDCSPECDCGRYVEIWNLVFMQFNRTSDGQVIPLPSPSIDTGMGLERISCVLQGVQSNYDTDLFRPIIAEACRLTSVRYGDNSENDVSLRILSDHSRACAFLIDNGVIPSNEGRGYVLRKILRRAIRHGQKLGMQDPFIFTLAALVSELMSDAFPELKQSREYTAQIVKLEEEQFSTTLSHGMQILNEICETASKGKSTMLPGAELFRLYDTYGFPLDLAQEIADERGFEIDEAGFYAEMEKQKTRARASWKGGDKEIKPVYQELVERGLETEFKGYDQMIPVPGKVLAIVQGGTLVSKVGAGETADVILDQTPFYAEAGGQVADRGVIENEAFRASVDQVFTPVSGVRLHTIRVEQGSLQTDDTVTSSISTADRISTARNHTATHLLHAALREVLGQHVKQSGSLVAPDRLRFDFTHYKSLPDHEIREIETLVNLKIRENIEVQTRVSDLETAIREGATALFGEKYQEQVRVVEISEFSMELCGGTHVSRTGDIALFKLVSENSISAGVRRVEAITGESAIQQFFDDASLIRQLSDELHVQKKDLSSTVDRIARELKEVRKELDETRLKLAQRDSGNVLESAREIKGVQVLSQKVESMDRNALRQLADRLKNQLKTGVVVLGAPIDGKVGLVVMVTPDLTDRIQASDLIRKIAPIVKGGGGGKPDMAEAGGKDPSRLNEALEQTYVLVEKLL
jgi:alanyl-tRNA synthetase